MTKNGYLLVIAVLVGLGTMAACAAGGASGARPSTAHVGTPTETSDDEVDREARGPRAPASDTVVFGDFTVPLPEEFRDEGGTSRLRSLSADEGEIVLIAGDRLSDRSDAFCFGFAQGQAEGHLSRAMTGRIHLDVVKQVPFADHASGADGCVIAGLAENVTPELPVMVGVFRYDDVTASVLCFLTDGVSSCARVIDGFQRARGR
jgi:hypothetical protein